MFAECRTKDTQHTWMRTRPDRRTPVGRAHVSRVRRAHRSDALTLARAAANAVVEEASALSRITCRANHVALTSIV